ASLSARVSIAGRNSMTTGSAFNAANGTRSASCQRRIRTRSVRNSGPGGLVTPSACPLRWRRCRDFHPERRERMVDIGLRAGDADVQAVVAPVATRGIADLARTALYLADAVVGGELDVAIGCAGV